MSPRSEDYDDAYLERREKRLQNRSMLRQVSAGAAILAGAMTAAAAFAIADGGLKAVVVGAMMLSLWFVAILAFVLQRTQSTIDSAIQDEYEQWNQREWEKPKRRTQGNQPNTVRLTDDGELREDQDEHDSETDTQYVPRARSVQGQRR